MLITDKRIKEIIQESMQKVLSESLDNLGDDFRQVSGESLKPYLSEVWSILQKSYANIGGFLTYKNENELLAKASLVALHFLGDVVDVCAVYTAYLGGHKLVGCGTKNNTPDEKSMLKKIIKDDIDDYSQWHWAEVSPPLEYWFKNLGGTMIPNIYVAGLLNREVEFGNDGYHYIRTIGKDHIRVEKVIYGFRDEELYNKVISLFETEVFFDNSKSQKLTESKQITSDLRYAINIIQRINNLWEDGYSEITPYMKTALISSIVTIAKYMPSKDMTLNSLSKISKYLSDNTTILHSYKFKDSGNIADSVLNQLA